MMSEKKEGLGWLRIGGERAQLHDLTGIQVFVGERRLLGAVLHFFTGRADRKVMVHLYTDGVASILKQMIAETPASAAIRDTELVTLCRMIVAGADHIEERENSP